MNDYKITALYARLSSDDMQEGVSNSIVHQKAILQEYAINNGFSNRQFYVDDGWSGTSFNRPDFKRMLADVESGIIDTIIVKDLSRFGSSAFRKSIEKSIKTRNDTDRKLLEKQLEETKNRIDEVENTVKKMYEEKLSGSLDNETFAMLSEGYVKEKKSLENTVNDILRKLSEENRIARDISVFFNALDKNTEVTELTQEIVANLIDRIEVHEGTSVAGKRIKNNRVDIYFIGAGIIEI